MGIEFPYCHDHGLRQFGGVPADLTDEERTTREALRTKYNQLEAQYQDADELPDEVDQRLGEIEAALEAFETRPQIFDPVPRTKRLSLSPVMEAMTIRSSRPEPRAARPLFSLPSSPSVATPNRKMTRTTS